MPNPEWATSWAEAAGKPGDLTTLRNDPEFLRALGVAVDDVNRGLSVVEKVRRFAVAAEPFSIDNEQMTPTMKIRRHVIAEKYGPMLDALYE